jgi:hypothetical protein
VNLNYPKNHDNRLPFFSITIVLFSVFAFLANTYRYHLERWDDAYITFRFAEHLSSGQGLIWNINGERVEGFTSLLHVLFLACGFRVGLDPWLLSLLISLLSVFITVAILLIILWRQFGTIHPIAATFVGIYLIDISTAIHTTSGLETHVFAAILAVCLLIAFQFIENQTWLSAVGLGVLTFLSCLTRPEAVIYGGGIYLVIAIFCIFSAKNEQSSNHKTIKFFVSSIVLILLSLGYLTWKYNYFGYILPNPYYVKSNKFSFAGLSEVTDYLKHLLKWITPLMLAVIVVIIADFSQERSSFGKLKQIWREFLELCVSPKNRAKIFLVLVPPLFAIAYYSTIIHEVGGAYRFSYPTYFYILLSCALLFSFLESCVEQIKIKQFGLISIGIIWLCVLLISQKSWQTSPISPSDFNKYHSKIADALKSTGLGSEGTVLCDAAGIIPYVSGFNQVDRVGLVDNFLSGRKPVTLEERESYIWSRPIDVYVGYEPPAEENTSLPENDQTMKSRYVSEALMQRKLELIESRIFVQDPQLLHSRLRELRDNWYFLGETQSPNWDNGDLKSFIYVRRDSPNAQLLITKLKNIIDVQPKDLNLNNINKQ